MSDEPKELPAWMLGKIDAPPKKEDAPISKPSPEVAPSVEDEEQVVISEESTEAALPYVDNPVLPRMEADIVSWGKWLIGIGVVHFIGFSLLDFSWGAILILLGALSFLVRSPSLYIPYAVTMAWAALSNLLAGVLDGDWKWGLFSLVQFYLAIRIVQRYLALRRTGLIEEETALAYVSDFEGRKPLAPRLFPWLGLLGGSFTLLTFFILFVAIIITVALNSMPKDVAVNYFGIGLDFLFNLNVIFLSINLTSLISRYRPRALSILGMLFSSVLLVAMIVMWFS